MILGVICNVIFPLIRKALCWNNRLLSIGKLILYRRKALTDNSIGTIIQSVIWSELDSHYHRTWSKYEREIRECDISWQLWMIIENVKSIFLKQNIRENATSTERSSLIRMLMRNWRSYLITCTQVIFWPRSNVL